MRSQIIGEKRTISSWTMIQCALCLVVIALSGCSGDEAEKTKAAAPSGPPPAVLIAEVRQETIPLFKEFTARTDATSSVEIRARVEGILESQHFEEGKMVKKDQILFEIDRRPFQASLQSATAKLQKAEADLAYALKQVSVLAARAELAQAQARFVREDKELQRATALTKQGVQTQQDLDTAVARQQAAQAEVDTRQAQVTNAELTEDANIKQASAAVEVAKSDITQASLNLEYCTMKAPFDGLIGLLQVDVGNLVGRGEPTLLTTVSNLDPIRVSMAFSETDYLRLIGNRAKNATPPEFEMVLADGTPYPHKGRFLMVDRAVDLKTGTLNFIAEFPNPGNTIRPGQFARVRVAVEVIDNAVLVPQKAAFDLQSAKVVYVVGPENKVELRTVQVADRYEDLYVVTEGLRVGEKVIVEGQLKAKPGSVVAPTDKPASQEKPAVETKGQ